MFSRLSKRSRINRILLITLSNIGDIVLTFPVFDALREAYPEADISVVSGPKGQTLLENNPNIYKFYCYDKHASLKAKLRWLQGLRQETFDLVVDLRNSMMPFLLRARTITFPAIRKSECHMKDRHFDRLKSVMPDATPSANRLALYISPADDKYIADLLGGFSNFIIIAPGAADPRKRWPEARFMELVIYLTKVCKSRVVIVGDKADAKIAARIVEQVPEDVLDLSGRTSLPQLAAVLKKARLGITNDSGIMHLASYLNIPLISMFGPTNPDVYGPWSSNRYILRSGSTMQDITVDDVISALEDWLHGHPKL